jgi:hypothetical protein
MTVQFAGFRTSRQVVRALPPTLNHPDKCRWLGLLNFSMNRNLRGASRSMTCQGALIFLVGVRPGEVEVQLVGMHFGQELAAAGEVF